jgi:2',3'-cyclic-nucleotide 2'-phosphodiesterase (5'-nucleotidase family)
MDSSRTGCSVPAQNNVTEALGKFKGKTYIAPNGAVFGPETATAKVARIVMDAQPEMARVKDVIAYSPVAMGKAYPESALTNWYIDAFMQMVEKISGKKVHVGVANFGGVRVDMPQGDVILDDMLSMFPFKNSVIYLEHKGSVLRKTFEEMAANSFHVLGGVKIIAENGKLVSVEIAGEPLDDDKVYGVVTNSFLLYGGDGLFLATDAVEMKDLGVLVSDVMLDYVKGETAAGRQLTGSTDGRIIIKKQDTL